ncbi:hypothetical protein PIB30_098495 [Stylosanthes scabra]|uniref:Uncharacterized protein n=1 Tax=Stylosanthes scabra TaxID=79078 RepID=A0ABU6UYZ8_9FABA|nr:hypothetical protein [Stylosanthes scabra]
MAAASTTLRMQNNLDENGDEEFHMVFWLAGVKYALDLDELASIWGLQNCGTLFKGGKDPPEDMSSSYHERAIHAFQLTGLSGGSFRPLRFLQNGGLRLLVGRLKRWMVGYGGGGGGG